PKDVLVEWYDALIANYEGPNGTLMDAMARFYTSELQDEFHPDVDPRASADEKYNAEKMMIAAAKLHKDWGAFLVANGFTRANFERPQDENREGDTATVVIRSDKNVARSFSMVNEPGHGWVISKLPSPTQYAVMVRTLVIILVGALVLAILARKLIFS
ncbi:MAG: hypothetical protein HXY48_01875, partial [Ignavibacteriaceae bacterium]|nr:hypothetical protein [Ignavibacteriaceae bacterium]